MTKYEQIIIGYLLKHPNSKFVDLCQIDLPISVPEVGEIVDGLVKSGQIECRGFASHVEEYSVTDGGKFMSNENLGTLKDTEFYPRVLVEVTSSQEHDRKFIKGV